MEYKIIGDMMPVVEVLFDAPGESMYTQSGGMAWMLEGVVMDSNMKGGLGKGIGRMFSGESLFMATYRAERAGRLMGIKWRKIWRPEKFLKLIREMWLHLRNL